VPVRSLDGSQSRSRAVAIAALAAVRAMARVEWAVATLEWGRAASGGTEDEEGQYEMPWTAGTTPRPPAVSMPLMLRPMAPRAAVARPMPSPVVARSGWLGPCLDRQRPG
jgi:hypothetical protein